MTKAALGNRKYDIVHIKVLTGVPKLVIVCKYVFKEDINNQL